MFDFIAELEVIAEGLQKCIRAQKQNSNMAALAHVGAEARPATTTTTNGQEQKTQLSKIDEAQPVATDMIALWEVESCRSLLSISMKQFAAFLKNETGRTYAEDDIWRWLCRFRIPYFMLRQNFVQDYMTLPSLDKANWICTILENTEYGAYWQSDILARAKNIPKGARLVYESRPKAEAPAPGQIAMKAEGHGPTELEIGLSEYEFTIDGKRYYYDQREQAKIPIPDEMEARPSADAWLNKRTKNWVSDNGL